jgi:hypothetical protein
MTIAIERRGTPADGLEGIAASPHPARTEGMLVACSPIMDASLRHPLHARHSRKGKGA